MRLSLQPSCMWDDRAGWWLVAEVNAMDPLCAGDTLPCICPFTEVLVARNGVTHNHQRRCHALLGTLHAPFVRQNAMPRDMMIESLQRKTCQAGMRMGIVDGRLKTSTMKVRVGRVLSSSHLSVHDLISASVCLMISRTVKPEGPAARQDFQSHMSDLLSPISAEGAMRLGALQRRTDKKARGQQCHTQQDTPT